MDRRENRLVFVAETRVETHSDIVSELKKRYKYQKQSDMTYEWKKSLLMDIYKEELELLDAMNDCCAIEVEDPDSNRRMNTAFVDLNELLYDLFELKPKLKN